MAPTQDWINDSRGGGTRPLGPSRKRSPSVSKGPKPPIQILQLLKNSQSEVKRAHFRNILAPGSHPENEINGARKGRSLPVPPGFLQPCAKDKYLPNPRKDNVRSEANQNS